MQKFILSTEQIYQKIKRIAFEIYEQNFEENTLVLAGITGEGYEMARLLQTFLEEISQLQVVLMRIDLNKLQPHLTPVQFDLEKSRLGAKSLL